MSIIPAALEPYVIYVKLAIGLGLLAAVAIAFFHFGTLSSERDLATYKTAVEAQHATQVQAVADAYYKQLTAAAAAAVSQQGVIDDLNEKLKNSGSSAAGLAQRVLDDQAAAVSANCGPVPKAGTMAAGNAPAPGVPRSDPEAVRLLQSTFDAGTRDADRLRAAQALAPKP
jgi:hypothetical protein